MLAITKLLKLPNFPKFPNFPKLPKTQTFRFAQFVVRRVSDVVAGRSLQIRSLLEVNEEFANKPDAADDPL